MKKIALIGTKEFSEQIITFANETGEFEFVGYFDDLVEKGTIINGKPVLGKVEEAIDLYKDGIFDYIFEGIGYTRFDLREFYYNMLKGKVPFANIISKTAVIGKDVVLGEGIYLGSDSYVGEGTVVEDNVFIHGSSHLGHENKIGSHTYFSGRVDTAGFCEIGKRNFWGIRTLCADHITVCDDVWIGIGCVVAKDIKQPGKYMSSAAKLYKID